MVHARRSRRGTSTVGLIVVALVTALVAGLLGPTSASAATQGSLIRADVTPSGSLEIALDTTGADPALLQQSIATSALPSAGTLSERLYAYWYAHPVLGSAPQPGDSDYVNFDGTIELRSSQAASSLVVVIPPAQVHTALSGWLAGAIGLAIGYAAGWFASALCIAALGSTGPVAVYVCPAVLNAVIPFVATLVGTAMTDGKQVTAETWTAAVALAIAGALSNSVYVAGKTYFDTTLPAQMRTVATRVYAAAKTWGAYLSQKAFDGLVVILDTIQNVADKVSGVIRGLEAEAPVQDPLPAATPGRTSTRKPDPSTIRVGSSYLSVEQVANRGVAVRLASSIAGLASAPLTTVWVDPAFTAVWAPEVMRINNRIYIYFSAGAGAEHRMYVISSGSPLRGYSAPQRMALPDDRWAIDGTTMVFGGQRYFVWSGWEGTVDGEQNLYLAKMTDPTTTTGPRYRISQPREPWERITGAPYINEGPEAIKDPNGQLHVTYSANGSWSDQYCLGDLRLKVGGDPTNVWDWHKSNGCLFGSNKSTIEPGGWDSTLYANGPGHHTFVLPDGDINQSPNAAYPATAPFMYHAVPKGLNYTWDNRVRYEGAYTWYNNINYNRCCVPGDDTTTGYSLMYFEDPHFTPNPPPKGPPAGGTAGPGPGLTGIKNADPSVMRVASTYVSAESDGKSISVREASSTKGLGGATPFKVYTDTAGLGEVWAPEIYLISGRYFIYFSAGAGAGHHMYVISSNSSLGGWSAPTRLVLPGGDTWAVDGATFVFGGKRYFTWSGWAGTTNGEQNIYIAEMINTAAVSGVRYVISQPRESWEKTVGNPNVNEAPAPIIDPSGQLHIAYSANGSWSDQYCVADLRLRAGGDPLYVWDWYKSNGCQFGSNPATMMKGWDATLYVNGPGSHSFVLLNGDIGTSPPSGKAFPLMYHAVPKGTAYSWAARTWYAGSFEWYAASIYTRCCVPGATSDSGWGLKYYEDVR
jgi:GH43 family beta-xylosidase